MSISTAEIYEDLRTLLREPQMACAVPLPQTYDDQALCLQLRSAIRHLSAMGMTVTSVLDTTGNFTTLPATDLEAALLTLRAAKTLLRGDLMQRVLSGQMGVDFTMGLDSVDTKTVAIKFGEVAASYEREFDALLPLAFTYESAVFGGPISPGSQN